MKTFTRRTSLLVYGLLGGLVWIAHFLLFKSFGLYEDDWRFTGNAITNTLSQNIERIYSAVITFWQGRPLHMSFLTLLPYWGAKLGGILTLYWMGFLILSCNACLFYRLLTKITSLSYWAIISSFLFCLYPADTTFNYLQHLLGLQTALLLLLVAFNLFVSSTTIRTPLRLLSYVLATLALLTYESPFLLFFTAPFLKKITQTKKQIFIHSLILTIILFLYLGLRKIAGESRMAQFTLWQALQKLVYQLVVGPLIVSGTFLLRPWQIVSHLNINYLIILGVATACFYGIITYIYETQFKANYARLNTHLQLGELIRLLKLGLMMLILAYPAALLLDVSIIDGRASRVHFSAVMGSTIVMGSLWCLLFLFTYPQKVLRGMVKGLLSIYLALLLAFAINVQQYYALSWQYQQDFWHDVLTLSPDITENTVVLVQAPNLAWGKQINPFDWSMPSVLSSIYHFPENWQFPPRVYVLNSNTQKVDLWQGMIQSDGSFLLSNQNHGVRYHYDWEPERLVKANDVILLVEENKRLVRQSQLMLSDSRRLLLKQNDLSYTLPPFPTSVIFSRLIPAPVSSLTKEKAPAIYLEPQK